MKRTKKTPRKTEKVLKADANAAALRFLVANYYQFQEMRKRTDMQFRHLGDRVDVIDEDIMKFMTLANEQFAGTEGQAAKTMKKVLAGPVAQWIVAQRGIAHILAAGLLAHIDITKAPTAGHIYSFAGLNPEMKWKKGEKRPYNAQLKQLCWHAGQCFMKQSNDPDCYYGHLYRERKKYEIERNEAGGNAELAKTFKVSPTATKAVKDKLKKGQLPDFNIDARARRYAVKIFLSHLHAVMYWHHYKKAPPKPYAIQHLGHAHEIKIPNLKMFPGLSEAYYGEVRHLEAAE